MPTSIQFYDSFMNRNIKFSTSKIWYEHDSLLSLNAYPSFKEWAWSENFAFCLNVMNNARGSATAGQPSITSCWIDIIYVKDNGS